MIELDAGLAGQMALVQQRATLGFMKQAADSQKQVADMLATTVAASDRGSTVDISA